MFSVRNLSLAVALALAAAATSHAAETDIPADAQAAYDEVVVESLPPEVREQLDAAAARALELYTILRESAEPRDWAIASQLPMLDESATKGSGAERAELLRNAAAAAPEDALVQWLAATEMPYGGSGCSAPVQLPANLDAVMRLESDNGLAWLPVLQQAAQNKDALSIDTTLAHIAAASRFDNHEPDYVKALLDVARRHPEQIWFPKGYAVEGWSPQDMQFQAAYMQAQMLSPPLYALTSACDRDAQPDADLRRFSVCADVGRGMAKQASSASLRYFGLSLVNESGHYGPDDRATERELMWLRESLWSTDPARKHAGLSAMQTEYLRSGDDVRAQRAALIATGKPVTPPPTWQPSYRIEDAGIEDDADIEEIDSDEADQAKTL